MPKLKVMDSDALNAFATGLNRRQYSVTVTTGLLKALNDREIEAVLGHELTHIRNGDVQLMVIAVVIAGVVGFFARIVLPARSSTSNWNFGGGTIVVLVFVLEQRQQGRRRGDRRRHPRGGVDRAGLAVVAGGQAGAVALARTAGGCRIGGADQKSGCHDLGAAQDREPRRTAGRHLGGDGNVPRQSARGFCRPVRDPPVGGFAGRGAGEIRRRPRSRTARAAAGHGRRSTTTEAIRSGDGRSAAAIRAMERCPCDPPATPAGALGQACGTLGAARRVRTPPGVNELRRINPARTVNELNYPLFLPCSRPKQAWGRFDRPSGRTWHCASKGFSWRSQQSSS